MSFRRGMTLVCLTALLCACGADTDPGGQPDDSADASALERLGVAEADAQRYALDALTSGQVYGWVSAVGRSFKALSNPERAGVVASLAGWARHYAESDLFQAAYARSRAESEPRPPTYAETIEQTLERRVQESLDQLEQSRRDLIPVLAPDERDDMLQSLDEMAEQYRDPQLVALQRQGIEMERAGDAARFEAARAEWQQRFPENPNELIKRRLQTFLDTCADVDFDAELIERDGRLRFANRDYERRSWEWKACFRAGQPSVRAARDAAAAWLGALG